MDLSMLPEQARYGADAVLLKSSRVSTKFFPQNAGQFGPALSRTVRFDISSPHFLDLSQARFNASFTLSCDAVDGAGAATSVTCLDGGLGGIISRISIMNSSGQLLERIDDYNQIQTILNQCSDRSRLHGDDLLLEEQFIGDVNKVAAAPGANNYTMKNGDVRDLSHQMQGAWFQTSKKKLLPPGVMFQLEVEIVNDASAALVSGGNATTHGFTLDNVSITIPAVQIMSQAFEDNTARLMTRGFSWVGSTYKRYSYSTGAGIRTDVVPDKSLALTGVLIVNRLNANLNTLDKYQNYLRNGAGFTGKFNIQIGSEQYPASQIDYLALADARSGGNSKMGGAVQQIKAVLGGAPNSVTHQTFGAGADGGGNGFLAVQVGYQQGIGIDTQSASLPVIAAYELGAAAALSTTTVYTQCTATFRMMPNMGQMEVVSFI
jgi:hypothetical protein